MRSLHGQAMPEQTVPMGPEAFENHGETSLYWLGGAGVMVNSRGTLLLVDPVLVAEPSLKNGETVWISESDGTPLLRLPPIAPSGVKRLDAVLYTHSDGDHLGRQTALALCATGCIYHATGECAEHLRQMGIPEDRMVVHPKLDRFEIGDITVQMTLADHPWQKLDPETYHGWHFTEKDCTGYKLYTPDGVVWIPGDTLPRQEHMENSDVDVMFADFSDDPYHYGAKNMIELCNHLPRAELIASHWGTLDMPDSPPQNADPYSVRPFIVPADRLHILAPGERYVLKQPGN